MPSAPHLVNGARSMGTGMALAGILLAAIGVALLARRAAGGSR